MISSSELGAGFLQNAQSFFFPLPRDSSFIACIQPLQITLPQQEWKAASFQIGKGRKHIGQSSVGGCSLNKASSLISCRGCSFLFLHNIWCRRCPPIRHQNQIVHRHIAKLQMTANWTLSPTELLIIVVFIIFVVGKFDRRHTTTTMSIYVLMLFVLVVSLDDAIWCMSNFCVYYVQSAFIDLMSIKIYKWHLKKLFS